MASTIYGTAFDIVPNDATNLPQVATGIYVGGTGVVVVQLSNGDVRSFAGALAGTILPIQVKKVFASGTTATNLVGLVS